MSVFPLDTSKPNIARVYDYWLGGKDNFEADRVQAEQLLVIFPGLRQLVRENRQFIIRAVAWVAAQGVRQFIDLGAGLPTSPAVHEAARTEDPGAAVVYVDYDPMVVNHANALLTRGENHVTALRADLRDPAAVLADPVMRDLVDMSEPVCLVMAAVLHLMEADQATELAAAWIKALAPGSYVIITLARYEDPEMADQIMAGYTAGTFRNHSREQAAMFLSGLELVEPGITDGWTWRAGMPEPAGRRAEVYPLAGVARKPLTHPNDAPAQPPT